MIQSLAVVADRRIMGEIQHGRDGRLAFRYDDAWRADGSAYPLSLSMPLVVADHGHARVEPWLWGLLPDNEMVLMRWGEWFQTSPRSAFSLLSHVGEDCPGAIQLVRPDRVPDVLGDEGRSVEWLSEADVAERLRALEMDHAAWRSAHDPAWFSLAGAQAKTALLRAGQRWGVPYGATPTTHILKPPVAGSEGHAENEHLCLELAAGLGLPVPRSEILRFEDRTAIVVSRYDRVPEADGVRRLHQEDFCQALGVHPALKYQRDGGPGCARMVDALRTHSSDPETDVCTFVRAVILNWLVGGTDAHAKNYSALLGLNGRVRLAPLYDIASALPYGFRRRGPLLAMKVGGRYRIDEIHPGRWERFASEVQLPSAEVLALVRGMAEALPGAVDRAVEAAGAAGLDHPVMERMRDALRTRAEACVRGLAPAAAP